MLVSRVTFFVGCKSLWGIGTVPVRALWVLHRPDYMGTPPPKQTDVDEYLSAGPALLHVAPAPRLQNTNATPSIPSTTASARTKTYTTEISSISVSDDCLRQFTPSQGWSAAILCMPLPRLRHVTCSIAYDHHSGQILEMLQLLLRPTISKLAIASGPPSEDAFQGQLSHLLQVLPDRCPSIRDLEIKMIFVPTLQQGFNAASNTLRAVLPRLRALEAYKTNYSAFSKAEILQELSILPNLTDVVLFPQDLSALPEPQPRFLALRSFTTSAFLPDIELLYKFLSGKREVVCIDVLKAPLRPAGLVISGARNANGTFALSVTQRVEVALLWLDAQPLITLRTLVTAHLAETDFPRDSTLSRREMLSEMAMAWPGLQDFALGNQSWPIALEDLELLVTHCKNLTRLSISVDARLCEPSHPITSTSTRPCSFNFLNSVIISLDEDLSIQQARERAAAAARIIDGYWPQAGLAGSFSCQCQRIIHLRHNCACWAIVWDMVAGRQARGRLREAT